MEIIAHRGLWWPDIRRQNTLEAIPSGMGMELDARLGEFRRVKIQHDLDAPRGFTVLGEEVCARWPPGQSLFWDVKEPGVCAALDALLCGTVREASILFDYEFTKDVPPIGLQYLVRASENEPLEAALRVLGAYGVWLDTWTGRPWVTAEVIAQVQDAGKRAYIVSPELHHYPLDLALWRSWEEADGICTDYPHLAVQFFANAAPLYPDRPWWT